MVTLETEIIALYFLMPQAGKRATRDALSADHAQAGNVQTSGNRSFAADSTASARSKQARGMERNPLDALSPKRCMASPPAEDKAGSMSVSRWILVALLAAAPACSRAQKPCFNGLPDNLRAAVEQNNWKIVQREDLSESDLRFWKDRHPGECPGVAAGDFSPHAKQSFIVAVFERDEQKNLLEKVLLVTEKKHQPVAEDAVTTMAVATPYVVWKLHKGRYLGIDGTKASISRDSFVYEKMVGPASQYYYQGDHLRSFVLSR